MRHDRALSDVLRVMAGAESMVPKQTHRDALTIAAQVIDDNFPERPPRVLITGGYPEDPLTTMVQEVVQDVDEMRDTLAVLGDKVEELIRELKRAK